MKISYIFFLMIIGSCGNSYNYNNGKNDAYFFHSRGSKLKMEDLKSADQFFYIKHNLVLVWNINPPNDEYYDPHLLFYDSTLTFYSACYLPGMLDSIVDRNLYGELNRTKKQRSKWYRNDLPEEFQLILSENNYKEIGSKNECNKIIDSLKLISKNLVTIYYKQTIVKDGGYDYIYASSKQDSIRFRFKKSSSIDYKLTQLNFDPRENRILARHNEYNLADKTKKIVWEIMPLSAKDVLDNFYNQVWDSIAIQNKLD